MPNAVSISTLSKGCLVSLLCALGASGAFAAELGSKGTGPLVDADLAIKQFKQPAGFKMDLWAAEPMLLNPVALCFDEKGRVFVAETFRYRTTVYDIREHMNMYDDDLASRTVEDRAAMVKKYLGDKVSDLTKESEVVQLLEDRSGTGKADHSTIFAQGFDTILDGIGSGVLARKGNVYYADIPNLWLLKDTKNTGRADVRTSLSYGYGVHYNLTGHDLHGLRIGPDGRLYFSIGDRGIHVTNKEGKLLDYPDMGTVLRCNQDGSNLEVFAYGVRNPQKLAFDDHGNLWSGDNNCDHGDAARLIYIVENGDSGWRIGNQFSETTPAGVWNSEKLWHLQFPEQAAYIIPPVAHIANGPSGLAHYPGTGFPASLNDHFFLCDFRGASATSGIHSFGVKPKGAGFEMVDHTQFLWSILATDAEFSPDGRLYVTDWVQGWPQSQKGRIYRLYDPAIVDTALVAETKKLIADGMEKRSNKELAKLLAHADQRVRQEAQFELADRGAKAVKDLERVALGDKNQLARLHAVWGLGQISVKSGYSLKNIVPLLHDQDGEVRAQAAKIMGEGRYAAASGDLIRLLGDSSARAQFFAAMTLGKLGDKSAIKPILEMLRTNADKDAYIRHAGVMGLVGLADKETLAAAGKDNSRSVRMGVLLAMRRLQLPEIAMFLHDADQLVVLEAARAINDVPIKDAMTQLAALIDKPTQNEPLDWRVINANYRVGGDKNASALVNYAVQDGASAKIRSEALRDLETWAKPGARDRLTGLWRPLASRDGKPAAEALRPVAVRLLNDSPEKVRIAAIHADQKLGIVEAAPALLECVSNTKNSADVRVEALKALGEFHAANLPEAVKIAVADSNENVRKEGNRLQAQIKPGNATGSLAKVLENGSVTEQQGAFATVATLKEDAADQLLADWLDKLIAGKVRKEIQLDLIEAAAKRDSAAVKEKLQKYTDSQPKKDEFNGFRETLFGGNAEDGKKIFIERPEASCVRCHKINGEGGEVGPELGGIISRKNREYILESILYPNKQIALGFESVIVKSKSGTVYAGILKSEDAQELVINSPEDGIIKVKKSEVISREKGQSAMPEGMGSILSKQDLRNLVEYLASTKQTVAANTGAAPAGK
jgi:quinoprotein glucose dehydrogenase